MSDSAADALRWAFESGELEFPAAARVLFLRARAGGPWDDAPHATLQQSFKPWADGLTQRGAEVVREIDAGARDFPLVIALPPRQRDEARALMARAFEHVAADGRVLCAMRNEEGARTGEQDFAALAGTVEVRSKHRCRIFWAGAAELDRSLQAAWRTLDAPRAIENGAWTSRPGLFAWDHVDAGSALLASHLAADLAGRGADLGAGYGYLARHVIDRNPSLAALDLYEAEARALALAERNLAAHASRVALGYHWHDVTRGLPADYDFIVTNPPFHQSRDDDPGIGRAFIEAAARALVPGGRLFLVANRHLPYEAVLDAQFGAAEIVAQAHGYKIVVATRATNAARKAAASANAATERRKQADDDARAHGLRPLRPNKWRLK